jgi:GAF domain-containing protein
MSAVSQLRELQRVTGQIAAALDGETALATAVDGAASVLQCQTSSLFVMDWSNNTMRLAMSNIAITEGMKLSIRGLIGEAAIDNRVIFVTDAYSTAGFDPTIDICTATRTQSLLIVPISSMLDGERVPAVFVVTNKYGNEERSPTAAAASSTTFFSFSDEDHFLLSSIAKAAGSALHKLRLFRQAKESEAVSEKLLAVTKALAAEVSTEQVALILIKGLMEMVKASVVNVFVVRGSSFEVLALRSTFISDLAGGPPADYHTPREGEGHTEKARMPSISERRAADDADEARELDRTFVPRDRGIVGFVARSGKLLELTNVRNHPLFDAEVDELNLPLLPPPLLVPSRELQQHLRRSISILESAVAHAGPKAEAAGSAESLTGPDSARAAFDVTGDVSPYTSSSAERPSISPLLIAMSAAEAAAADAAAVEERQDVNGDGQHQALTARSRVFDDDEYEINDDDATATVISHDSEGEPQLDLGMESGSSAPRTITPSSSAPVLSPRQHLAAPAGSASAPVIGHGRERQLPTPAVVNMYAPPMDAMPLFATAHLFSRTFRLNPEEKLGTSLSAAVEQQSSRAPPLPPSARILPGSVPGLSMASLHSSRSFVVSGRPPHQQSMRTVGSQSSVHSHSSSMDPGTLSVGVRQQAQSMIVVPIRDQNGVIVAVLQVINKAITHSLRRRTASVLGLSPKNNKPATTEEAARVADVAWAAAEALSHSLEILMGPVSDAKKEPEAPVASSIATKTALAMVSTASLTNSPEMRSHRNSLPLPAPVIPTSPSEARVRFFRGAARKSGSTRHIGRVGGLLDSPTAPSGSAPTRHPDMPGRAVSESVAAAPTRVGSMGPRDFGPLSPRETERASQLATAAIAVAQQSHSQPFTAADIAVAESLAVSAGVCFHKAMMFADILRAQRKAEALLEIVKATTSEKNFFLMLQRMVGAAYHSLGADRITVFLVDAPRRELWCAESRDIGGWRISMNTGLVGVVARTGVPLTVADAYEDPRFDRTVDTKTGYRTKSVLCLPVLDSKGRVVAVIQALNKKPAASALHMGYSLTLPMSPKDQVAPVSRPKSLPSSRTSRLQGSTGETLSNVIEALSPLLEHSSLNGTGYPLSGDGHGGTGATSFDVDDEEILRACGLEIAAALKHKTLEMLLLQGENRNTLTRRPAYLEDNTDEVPENAPMATQRTVPPELVIGMRHTPSQSTVGSSTGRTTSGLSSPDHVTAPLAHTLTSIQENAMNPRTKALLNVAVDSLRPVRQSAYSSLHSPLPSSPAVAPSSPRPGYVIPTNEFRAKNDKAFAFGIPEIVSARSVGKKLMSYISAYTMRNKGMQAGDETIGDEDQSSQGSGDDLPYGTVPRVNTGGSKRDLRSNKRRGTFSSSHLAGQSIESMGKHSRHTSDGGVRSFAATLPENNPADGLTGRSHSANEATFSPADLTKAEGSPEGLVKTSSAPGSVTTHGQSLRQRLLGPRRVPSEGETVTGAGSDVDSEGDCGVSPYESSPVARMTSRRGSAPEPSGSKKLSAAEPDNGPSNPVSPKIAEPAEHHAGRSSLQDRMQIRLGALNDTCALTAASGDLSRFNTPEEDDKQLETILSVTETVFRSAPPLPEFNDWAFDVWSVPDAGFAPLVLHMLHDEGLVVELSLNPTRLCKFADAAASMYWHSLAFHSHFHGLHVFQATVMLLRHSGLKEANVLPAVDIFALLTAALCHDIDHPGVNNAFLSAIEDELSLRYNDQSVLENHHAAVTCALIRDELNGTDIVSHLGASDRRRVRQVIISSILATDMSKHFGIVIPAVKALSWPLCATTDAAGNPRPEATVLKERDRIHEIVLHAADLSGQVLPWDLASKWSDCIVAEFRSQAQLEIAAEIPYTQHMHNIDTVQECAELQSGKFSYIAPGV